MGRNPICLFVFLSITLGPLGLSERAGKPLGGLRRLLEPGELLGGLEGPLGGLEGPLGGLGSPL